MLVVEEVLVVLVVEEVLVELVVDEVLVVDDVEVVDVVDEVVVGTPAVAWSTRSEMALPLQSVSSAENSTKSSSARIS